MLQKNLFAAKDWQRLFIQCIIMSISEYSLFKKIFFELLSHLGHHITTGSFHQIWAIGLTLRNC